MNTNPTASKASFVSTLSLVSFVLLAASSAACSSTGAVAGRATTARLERLGALSRASIERPTIVEDRHDAVGRLDRTGLRAATFTQARMTVRR